MTPDEYKEYFNENEDEIKAFIQHHFTLMHDQHSIFLHTCYTFNPDSSSIKDIDAVFDYLKTVSEFTFLYGKKCNDHHKSIYKSMKREIDRLIEEIIMDNFERKSYDKIRIFNELCKRFEESLISDSSIIKMLENYRKPKDTERSIKPDKLYGDFVLKINSGFEENLLPRLIKEQYQSNVHEKTEMFVNISKILNYAPIPISLIKKWFESLENYDDNYLKYHYPMPKHYYELFKSVSKELPKVRNGICWEIKENVGRFLCENSRYAILKTYDLKAGYFEVIDLFHYKIRKLTIANGLLFPSKKYSLQFGILTFHYNYLLCEYNDYENEKTMLCLCKIDFEKWECQVVDREDLPYELNNFIIDTKDGNKFLYQCVEYGENGRQVLVFGQIKENNELVIEDETVITLKKWMLFVKLENSKICGLRFKHNRVKGEGDSLSQMEYCEIDTRKSNKLIKKFTFHVNLPFRVSGWSSNDYFWLDNKCYIISRLSDFHTVVFDVTTQLVSSIDFIPCAFSNTKLSLDFDGILSIFSVNNVTRFPLRKPEQLLNLVWFEIKRQTMLKENGLYEKAMNQLPLNSELQPFNMSF